MTFPLALLLEATNLSRRDVCHKLGMSWSTFQKVELAGLDVYQADTYAIACGAHPALVWPDWWEEDPAVVAIASARGWLRTVGVVA